MTSAALQDLQNRINSNTLTVVQQAALSQALTFIIPEFPTPDEISGGILTEDAPLAREWIAALYALQAEGSGAVNPTTQITWHINATTGNNANDGLTAATAIQSAAFLSTLWRGSVGGGRPQLIPATGSTISIFIDSDLPETDPISVLLDVDLPDGTQVNIIGKAGTATHTGTLATASVFARTSAGGQQTITDATVADFGAFIPSAALVQDSTSGGVGWLYAPFNAASATGVTSRLQQAQTPGSFAGIGIPKDPSAGDAYTLSNVTQVTLGQDWRSRAFPADGPSGPLQGSFFFYRLHFKDANTGAAGLFADSPGVIFVVQESIFDDVSVVVDLGTTVALANCLVIGSGKQIAVANGSTLELAGGALQGGASGIVVCELNALAEIVSDFVCASDTASGRYIVETSGTMVFESCGAFGSNTPASNSPLFETEGDNSVLLVGLIYGTDNGNVFEVLVANNVMRYASPATTAMLSSSTTFLVGEALSSSFGFNQATGAFVGPTTCTLAHLDAALGAGTGFGGSLTDPASGCIVRTF